MDHTVLNGSPLFWQFALRHSYIWQFEIWHNKSGIMFCERLRFGCLSSLVFVDSDQKCPPKQGFSVLPLIVLVSKTRSEPSQKIEILCSLGCCTISSLQIILNIFRANDSITQLMQSNCKQIISNIHICFNFCIQSEN